MLFYRPKRLTVYIQNKKRKKHLKFLKQNSEILLHCHIPHDDSDSVEINQQFFEDFIKSITNKNQRK